MYIGSKIRILRNSKNLSLDQLGAITGLTGSYIGRLERGEEKYLNPTLETLKKLATALNVTITELLSEKKKGRANV